MSSNLTSSAILSLRATDFFFQKGRGYFSARLPPATIWAIFKSMILDQNFLLVLIFGAIFISLILLVWLAWLEIRLKKLFRGRRAQDLQNVLADIQNELDNLAKKENETDSILKMMEPRLKRSVQHIGIVRFNPYADAGGDQSFTLALMDEDKNGFVISSLYGRESNRIFAKPIEGGQSRYQLSEEEKQAIEKAVKEA